MSVSEIPLKVITRLWGKAAGRCQYEGCNESLWLDPKTKYEFNISYVAHIYADQPKGPRYHSILSPRLKCDISNLMLLCDKHHRLVDREDVAGHPAERLIEMKRKHEQRVEVLTSIGQDRQSHILLYGANVGEHSAPLSWEKASSAMLPHYPVEKPAIEIGMKNSSHVDHHDAYWQIERENLRRQFGRKVRDRLDLGEIEHISVFGFAPQPLLIELGRLLSDIPTAEVYQLHREPPDWKWQDHPEGFRFSLTEPEALHDNVALNLSLSATIDDSRITRVLGDDTSVWTITIPSPSNDFLKSRGQLRAFRETFRLAMDRIKAKHGHDSLLHIFPAVPVAVAVEIGRIWMPKADLPMQLWDENRMLGGFAAAFDIRTSH